MDTTHTVDTHTVAIMQLIPVDNDRRKHSVHAVVKRDHRSGQDIAPVAVELAACFECRNIAEGSSSAECEEHLAECLSGCEDDTAQSVKVTGITTVSARPYVARVMATVKFVSVVQARGEWDSDVELAYRAISQMYEYMCQHAGDMHPEPAYAYSDADCAVSTIEQSQDTHLNITTRVSACEFDCESHQHGEYKAITGKRSTWQHSTIRISLPVALVGVHLPLFRTYVQLHPARVQREQCGIIEYVIPSSDIDIVIGAASGSSVADTEGYFTLVEELFACIVSAITAQ